MKKFFIMLFALMGILFTNAQVINEYQCSALSCDIEDSEESEGNGLLKGIIDPKKGSQYDWRDNYTGTVTLRTTNTNPPIYFMLYSDIIGEPFENNGTWGRKYDVGEKYEFGHFAYGRVNTDASSFSADKGNSITYEQTKYEKYYPNDPEAQEFGPLFVVKNPTGKFSFQYRADSTPEKWVTVTLTYDTKPGIITDVIDIENNTQDELYYDLVGHSSPIPFKGINIYKGKKIIK